jgi:hypothetical protein
MVKKGLEEAVVGEMVADMEVCFFSLSTDDSESLTIAIGWGYGGWGYGGGWVDSGFVSCPFYRQSGVLLETLSGSTSFGSIRPESP